ESPFRSLPEDLRKGPVPIHVYRPPEGRIEDFYLPYLQADLANSAFRKGVVDGLATDPAFAATLIQPDGKYGSVPGRGLVERIVAIAPQVPVALPGAEIPPVTSFDP